MSGAIGQLQPAISPGYGFTAIIVAFLGRLNPLGIVAAGLVLALTYLGGEAAQMSIGVSDKAARVFQGMLLFFVLACDTLIHYRIRIRSAPRPPSTGELSHGHARSHPADHRRPRDAAADRRDRRTGGRALRRAQSRRRGHDGHGRGRAASASRCSTGSPWLGVLAGIVAGALFSLLFGFLTLTLVANQVATGLALTLLGLGLSGMLGDGFVGLPGVRLPESVDSRSVRPAAGRPAGVRPGPDLLPVDRLTVGVAWFLFRTRAGLTLRSIGDNHGSAHALGINVIGIRYLAVMFGGACAGLAGAHLSLVYTPQWVENMTAGRGWIALALVVFASWRPWRVLAGAYLFGAVASPCTSAISLRLPPGASGFRLSPSQFLSSLPYLATVVVLVLISRNRRLTMMNTPASLGQAVRARTVDRTPTSKTGTFQEQTTERY